jgi:hypothetical protein
VDPNELNDLANKKPEKVKKLAEIWDQKEETLIKRNRL